MASDRSIGVSNRVRMQNVDVASSLNWAFSRMLASSPSRPSLMLATIPGRSGQARVRMWTAVMPAETIEPGRHEGCAGSVWSAWSRR